MNPVISSVAGTAGALRAALRPCTNLPRPIPCPQTGPTATIEGER